MSVRAPVAATLIVVYTAFPADARVTHEQAERLVGIALVTEWVASNCPTDELSAMLLLTTPSILKQLEPDKLKLGRKRVADRAARYGSKAAACRDFIAGLKTVQ